MPNLECDIQVQPHPRIGLFYDCIDSNPNSYHEIQIVLVQNNEKQHEVLTFFFFVV